MTQYELRHLELASLVADLAIKLQTDNKSKALIREYVDAIDAYQLFLAGRVLH